MSEDTKLTLLEFLEKVGSQEYEDERWWETELLWDEYAERVETSDVFFTDWTEVNPALQILARMIKAGLFSGLM